MEQAPEGTELVVLNENGEPEPLATETATAIIETGVAWWCPAGVQPGGAGCVSGSSLNNLFTAIAGGTYEGDGTIYISNAYTDIDEGTAIIFDNSDFGDLADLGALTVQGGWDTVAGTVNGRTTFTNNAVDFVWYYDLTINDLTFVDLPYGLWIEGYGTTDGTTFTPADVAINDVTVQGFDGAYFGVYVNSQGDISLNNVAVSNTETGADLRTMPDADVTVTNSSFTENGEGLYITTFPMMNNGPEAASQEVTDPGEETPWGTITLSNVIASNNDFYGAMMLSASDVNISNSVFSYNGALAEEGGGGGLGIWMLLPGTISLDHVDASNNNSVGMQALYMPFFLSPQSGAEAAEPGPLPLPMAMTMTVVCSTFNNNTELGFWLESWDPAATVDFIDTEATGNGELEVLIENAAFTEQTLGSCTTVPVTPPQALPLRYIAVGSGEPVTLDCVHYSGTVLVLPSGDKAIYYCQATGSANAKSLAAGELPGALGSGLTYVSAMEVGLENGGPVQILPDGSIKVAFQVPEGVDPASLAILFWDPEREDGAGEWVELPADAWYDSLYDPTDGRQVLIGPRLGQNGRFETIVNFTGVFALVDR